MEGEAEGLVHVLATPAVIEQVPLQVGGNREELAARRVRRRVPPVWARDAARERSCIPHICQKMHCEVRGGGEGPHRSRPGWPPRG